MKKFWMISMLLIAALFVISCGDGGDEEGGNAACTEQGAFKCNGDISQKCDQEEWKNFENCAESGKTCNATTGKCEAAGGNDNTDTGSDNTDTGNDNTDTGSQGGDACTDIYSCYSKCSDKDCAQACYDKGSSAGQSQFEAMLGCWENKCQNATTDEEFSDCVADNCRTETEACGLYVPTAGDTTYPSPYGTAQISLSSVYIMSQGEQPAQNTVAMGSFISGTLGNSSLTPAGTVQSYYQTSLSTNSQTGGLEFQTFQIHQSQSAVLEPVAILVTDATASAGTAVFSPTEQDAVGMLLIASQLGTDAQGYTTFGCYDALGVGELTITNIVAQTGSAGALAITGTIDLYSPANYPDYGDVTAAFGVAACPVK